MDNLSKEEIIKAERRRYKAEWRKNNPEKARKHDENYWLRRAEKRMAETTTGKQGA